MTKLFILSLLLLAAALPLLYRRGTAGLLYADTAFALRRRAAAPCFYGALGLLLVRQILLGSSNFTVTEGYDFRIYMQDLTNPSLSRPVLALSAPLADGLDSLLFWGIAALLLCKFFLCTQYSFRQLLAAGAVWCLVYLCLFDCYGLEYISCAAFLLSAKDVSFRCTARLHAALSTLLTGGILLAAYCGGILAEADIFMADAHHFRHAWGFRWPNVLAAYTLAILFTVLLLLCLRGGRALWLGLPPLAAALWICGVQTRNRTALLLIPLYLLLLAAALLGQKKSLSQTVFGRRVLPGLAAALPALFLVGSVGLALFYREGSPFWDALNSALSTRPALFRRVLTVQLPGLRGNTDFLESVPNLDSTFLYLLLAGGLLLTVLVLGSYSLLLYRSAAAGQYTLAACLLLWLVFGLTERYSFFLYMNPCMLLFAQLLYTPKDPLRLT